MEDMVGIDPAAALRYGSDPVKNNYKIIIKAITIDPASFRYAGKEVREQVLHILKSRNTEPVVDQGTKGESKTESFLDTNPIEALNRLLEEKENWEPVKFRYFEDNKRKAAEQKVLALCHEILYWGSQIPKRFVLEKTGDKKIDRRKAEELTETINEELKLVRDMMWNPTNLSENPNQLNKLRSSARYFQQIARGLTFDPDWVKRIKI